LQVFNKSILKKITVFVIGGIFHTCIREHKGNPYIYNQYKNIYVESCLIKESLDKFGFNNISVIPNFRNLPVNNEFTDSPPGKILRCVFMSKICEDKGIKIILEADKILKSTGTDYSVDFYGHIDNKIQNYFFSYIGKTSNLAYKNVIEYENINSITDVLKNYDVLIFPTKHKGEGMAGILVESKIAGVPPIVSAWNYNEEIITHNNDGIVLKDNTPHELANTIINLSSDRKLLSKLRYNAYQSGKDFLIDGYIDDIVNKI
jgi:glycosyltransferase involved in cell wall biosynthesis